MSMLLNRPPRAAEIKRGMRENRFREGGGSGHLDCAMTAVAPYAKRAREKDLNAKDIGR
jgi:hypothetical protein